MSKKLLYLLGILLTLIIGTILFWHFCCRCLCKCTEKESPPASLTGKYHPFNVSGMGYHCMENFNFLKGGMDHLLPLGDSLLQGTGFLKGHMDAVTGMKLLITGYCLPSEKEIADFPHLGYARARNIKGFLISRGFDPSSLEIRGKIESDLRVRGDTVPGPVGFEMVDLSTLPDSVILSDWASFKEKVNGNPIILYFDPGQSGHNGEQAVLTQLTALVNYLENVAEGVLKVTGHTDNRGSHALNVRLGQQRADFVKSVLVKNGIDNGRILTSSKGPDEPAGDNSTPEGRAKNRNTVIIIQ